MLILIRGYDDSFTQVVNTRYSYRWEEIEWSARFAPAFDVSPAGHLVLDLDRDQRVRHRVSQTRPRTPSSFLQNGVVLVEKSQPGRFDLRPELDRVAEHHGLAIVFGAVGLPRRQPFAVGIAGGDEVHPVGRHHVRQLAVHDLSTNQLAGGLLNMYGSSAV